MAKVKHLFLFMVLWGGLASIAWPRQAKEVTELSPDKIAGQIRSLYDSELHKLPLRKQGRYALRMYRTSGNEDYYYPILNELYIAADRLNNISKGVKLSSFRNAYIQKELELNHRFLSANKVKRALRKETLKNFSDHIFFTHLLLPELNRVSEMGMQLKNDNEKIKQALMAFNFKPGFTDPDMIRAWASKQSNQVYWLYSMGLGDYRGIYIDAFNCVYPANKDRLLSDQQYLNKIAGMTHLVIAASGYFQQPVSDSGLAWVVEYFEKNIDTIIARCEENIIADVGICMLLTGHKKSITGEKTRKKIASAFDQEYQMIPGREGDRSCINAQHRNSFGSILLSWDGSYFPGPYLYKIKKLAKHIPSTLEPEDDN